MQIYCRKTHTQHAHVGGSAVNSVHRCTSLFNPSSSRALSLFFLIHFQSLSHHSCEMMALIPRCFSFSHSFTSSIPYFFIPHFHTPTNFSLSSLHKEVISLTSFHSFFSSFSSLFLFSCQSLHLRLCFHAAL